MTRTVGQCRWAEPTLLLPAPQWLAAVDAEWSCSADGPTRPLEDSRVCRTCERFAARPGGNAARRAIAAEEIR